MTLEEFKKLVAEEDLAEERLRSIRDRPHMHYPIPGLAEAYAARAKAKARTIHAAFTLSPEDLR